MNIRLYFALILAISVGALFSCTSLEDHSQNNSEYIEFVVRPTNFDSQMVSTKVSTEGFENTVHNCYFLLFDENKNIVGEPINVGNSLAPLRISRDKFAGNNSKYTACFVANIPHGTLSGINSLDALNSVVLDIDYSSVDVTDAGNSNNPSSFVVPEFDLTGNGQKVQCLPMLGINEITPSSGDLFQIPLKRLFAKVSINISIGQSLSSATITYDLLAAHLKNLPTKVKLTPPTSESAWVKESSVFRQPIIEGPIDNDNIGILTSYNDKIYFYVPEYFLFSKSSSTANYGNEKYKPRMYDEDKFPVFVTLFGSYKSSIIGGEAQDVKYDLFLGENASTSFTLKRNEHYINNIVINGITNSIEGSGNTLDCRVEITKHDMVEIYGQTANCYIVDGIGTYTYPACKGVHKGGLQNIHDTLRCTKGTRLKILAQDNTSIKLENLVYNAEAGEFSFDITEVDEGTGAVASNDGNIILGLVYDEGGQEKVEWSWHIWLSGQAVWGIDAFELSTQTYPNTFVMMDRNLGARPILSQQTTAGVVNGLYYKYGRKEPYMEDPSRGKKYWGGGESKVYSWAGDSKTQTDPCPPGYRVPSSDVWKKGSNGTEPSPSHYTHILSLTQALEFWNDVYYPYSGYLDARGNPVSVGFTVPDTLKNQTVNIPAANTSFTGLLTAWAQAENYNPPLQFTNLVYSNYNINNLGKFYARNNEELEYRYEEKGIEVISCTMKIGKWVNKGSRLSPKYQIDYTNATTITYLKDAGTQLEANYNSHYNRLLNKISGEGDGSIADIWFGWIDDIFTAPTATYDVQAIENTSFGYQVRCVKE